MCDRLTGAAKVDPDAAAGAIVTGDISRAGATAAVAQPVPRRAAGPGRGRPRLRRRQLHRRRQGRTRHVRRAGHLPRAQPVARVQLAGQRRGRRHPVLGQRRPGRERPADRPRLGALRHVHRLLRLAAGRAPRPVLVRRDLMSKLPIVVAIPTKNEAENIARTVSSVIDHVEAVVVVDSHSTDDTCKIAAGLGAEIVEYTWDGGVPEEEAVVPGPGPDRPAVAALPRRRRDAEPGAAGGVAGAVRRRAAVGRRVRHPARATGSPGGGCGTATPSSNAP